MLPVPGTDGPRWSSSQNLTAATLALFQRDLNAKLRAAPLRKSPTVTETLFPGTEGCFLLATSL